MRSLSLPAVLNLIVSLEGKLIEVSVSPTCLIESAIKSSSPFTVTSPENIPVPVTDTPVFVVSKRFVLSWYNSTAPLPIHLIAFSVD